MKPLPTLAAGFAGLIFGFGLLLSGMADPAKVLAFLDITGRWDPSLALVMAGAIAVASPVFAWARRRERSLLGEAMPAPASAPIDLRLIGGAVVFGIGWGLAGYCPGPAVVSLGAGQLPAAWLVSGMVAGMAIVEWLDGRVGARP